MTRTDVRRILAERDPDFGSYDRVRLRSWEPWHDIQRGLQHIEDQSPFDEHLYRLELVGCMAALGAIEDLLKMSSVWEAWEKRQKPAWLQALREERDVAVHVYSGVVNGFDYAVHAFSDEGSNADGLLGMKNFIVQSGPLKGQKFLDFMWDALEWWKKELEWAEVERAGLS